MKTLRNEGYLNNECHAVTQPVEKLADLLTSLVSPEVKLTIQAVMQPDDEQPND